MCSGCAGDVEEGMEHEHFCPECQVQYVCENPSRDCEDDRLRLCSDCVQKLRQEEAGHVYRTA